MYNRLSLGTMCTHATDGEATEEVTHVYTPSGAAFEVAVSCQHGNPIGLAVCFLINCWLCTRVFTD